jgi:hypothetical protein
MGENTNVLSLQYHSHIVTKNFQLYFFNIFYILILLSYLELYIKNMFSFISNNV